MNVEDLTAALQTLSKSPASSGVLSPTSSTSLEPPMSTSQQSVGSSINSSGILVEETTPQDTPRSKAEIWSEIKLLSLSRSITALYIVGLLTLQSHVQLNILGRKSYLGSLADIADREAELEQLDAIARMASGVETPLDARGFARPQSGVSPETEMKYLTFSWWLLHKSWKQVAERVQAAVNQVFSK
jgi:peroxin-3